jgi:hypothetical protein
VVLENPTDPAAIEITKLAKKISEAKLNLKGKRLPLA